MPLWYHQLTPETKNPKQEGKMDSLTAESDCRSEIDGVHIALRKKGLLSSSCLVEPVGLLGPF